MGQLATMLPASVWRTSRRVSRSARSNCPCFGLPLAYPHDELVTNVMWALDDFTHRLTRPPGSYRVESRRTQRKGGAQLRPRVSCLTATLRAIICHGRLQIGESSIDGADGCITHVFKRLRGQSSPAPAGAVYEYRLIRIRTDALDLHLEEAPRNVYRTRNRTFRMFFGLTNV